MLLEIVLSKDKTQATLHYSNGNCITLYHSDGLVCDLIAELLYGHETYSQYIESFENTTEIDISQYEKVG